MDGSGGDPVKGSGAGFEWDADSQLYYHARFPFVPPSPYPPTAQFLLPKLRRLASGRREQLRLLESIPVLILRDSHGGALTRSCYSVFRTVCYQQIWEQQGCGFTIAALLCRLPGVL